MATKPKTLSERMRSAKRSQADEWLEELGDTLSVWKAGAEEVAHALDEVDLDVLEGLPEALEQLPGTSDFADTLREVVGALSHVLEGIGTSDVFTEFVEAYETAESALADYVDCRDGDSYPGIGDERREAWEEAAGALREFADQIEQMENVDEPATATHVDEDED